MVYQYNKKLHSNKTDIWRILMILENVHELIYLSECKNVHNVYT